MWVWSYPTVDSSLRDLLLRKTSLGLGGGEEEDKALQYQYGHLGDVWYYLYNQEAQGKIEKVCPNTLHVHVHVCMYFRYLHSVLSS